MAKHNYYTFRIYMNNGTMDKRFKSDSYGNAIKQLGKWWQTQEAKGKTFSRIERHGEAIPADVYKAQKSKNISEARRAVERSKDEFYDAWNTPTTYK